MYPELENGRFGYSPAVRCPPVEPIVPVGPVGPSTAAPAITYHASNTLSKKLFLPDPRRWQVPKEDLYMEGRLVVYVKSKGLLRNRYSNVKTRSVALTRRGFLVIYMKANKGFILDVGAAKNIECTTHREFNCLETHMKITYNFGKVHLWGLDKEGIEWNLAMQQAYEGTIPFYKPPSAVKQTLTPPQQLSITSKMDEPSAEEQPAQIVESEYLATELRPGYKTESAVSWMLSSLTDDENEDQQQPEKNHTKAELRDASTNFPSKTQVGLVRYFFHKNLPCADSTTSTPQVQALAVSEESTHVRPLWKSTWTNKEIVQPKHKVSELREPNLQQSKNEKKGLYGWFNKKTRSPEKIEESLTTTEYGRILGLERPMIGTKSETNV